MHSSDGHSDVIINSSDGLKMTSALSSILVNIVVMGNDDIIFRSSLLTSWVTDVRDVRRYYDA
jgi:hypothetical protein